MKCFDLTQVISPQMPVYPGTEPPVFTDPCTIGKDGFREKQIRLFTHTGTHIDSPGHVYGDGLFLDQFPIEQFTGKALVIDCKDLMAGDKIHVQHIHSIKDQLDQVDFVIFNTGWSKKWGKEEYFNDFPVISEELADKLSKLNIKGVGMDTISVEPITSTELKIHKILLGQNMIIVENLTNLDILEDEIFTFCCFPLKIRDADGSPVRAVAMKG